MNGTVPLATVKHQVFSFDRVRAMAANTLTELVRLRVFYFLLVFALLLIVSSIFWTKITFQQQVQVLKDISLGAMSIFTALLAILATAMMIPKDVEDRTLYTILAKPVPRFEYLLGKLLGIFSLLGVAILAMTVVFGIAMGVRYLQLAGEIEQELAAAGSESIETAITAMRAQIFDWHLLAAIGLLYLKAAILASITLFLSTVGSSWIFTVMISSVVYLIGHFQGEAREYLFATADGGVITRVLFGLMAILFPDLQLFNLVDDIVVGAEIVWSLLWKTVALGLFYIVIYTLAAYFVFATKEF